MLKTKMQEQEPGFTIDVAGLDNKIVLTIDHINDLERAVQMVRRFLYPDFKYKLRRVWHTWEDIIFIAWADKLYPLVEIWLETTMQNFPKSLKKPGCEFVKKIREEYRLVCKND